MSRSALAPFDWPGWRADVVERLDRRSIIAGLAFAVVWSALNFVGHRYDWGDTVVRIATLTLFMFSTVMVTMAVLAVALVAVTRGNSVWLAYSVAGLAVVALRLVIGLVIDPFSGFEDAAETRRDDRGYVCLVIPGSAAVLYVCEQRKIRRESPARRRGPNGRPRRSAWPGNA
jgi:hypothetical protein